MKHGLRLLLLLVTSLWAGLTGYAQENIELRFLCFDDGAECEVYDDLLARFSREHPGVAVAVEIAEGADIPARAGDGYDLARISDLAALQGHYLDLRPHLADAEAFAAGFQTPFLEAMRAGPGDSLHGFPDALGVVAPFVNLSLFEEAGTLPTRRRERLGRVAGGIGAGRRGDGRRLHFVGGQ